MFSHRVTHYPAFGKGPDVRALLEERVKSGQASGIRAGLSSHLLGADGQAFVMTVIHPDLAAYDKRRRGNAADPGFRAYQTKLAEVIRKPNSQELFEVLVAAPPSAESATFIVRNIHYPVPGKNLDLRALLEERVKSRQAQGARVGLSVQLFGSDGVSYVLSVRHPDLAAYEKYRQDTLGDRPENRAYQAKLGELQRATRQELFEILIPVPSD